VEQELGEAEQWVQAHIGEFIARCSCGAMLTAPALPHWAYQPTVTDHGVLWPVWSPEMWKLVLAGELKLWMMSFMLRTSPEGLRYTAIRRGEPWPDDLNIEEAEVELRVRLLADDKEYTVPLKALGMRQNNEN
jgi:hypothetical protein